MDRLIATTAKDGAYTVTVSGLDSWEAAERIARLVHEHLLQPEPKYMGFVGPLSADALDAIEKHWRLTHTRTVP